MHLLVPATVLGCLLAGTVHAENVATWDFRGKIPQQAEVHQLTNASVGDDGLRINTTSDGFMVWEGTPLTSPVDVVTIHVQSAKATDGAWLWHAAGRPDSQLAQLFFAIEASETMQEINIDVSEYDEWDWKTKSIGLAFPAGSDVRIERIEFRHWSPLGKLIEGWKSFWTFDTFSLSSINFLWGPLLAFNSVARSELYLYQPPSAWSAMRLFYGIMVLAAIACIAYTFYAPDKKQARIKAMRIIGGTMAVLWLVFGLRMDMELLSYAKTDLRTYVFAPEGEKTLRYNGDMYERINEMIPMIQEHDRYAILASSKIPYVANLRYITYPIPPVLEGQPTDGVTLWVILDRPDVRVDAEGRLTKELQPGTIERISPPGTIIKQLNDSSFLFSVTPPTP